MSDDSKRRLPYDDTDKGWVGVPHAKTETSKAAAEKMKHKVSTLRRRCFEFVHARGAYGGTPHEASDSFNMPTNSIGPRFCELRELGKIIKTPDTRPTRTGGRSRVHIAVEDTNE